MKSRRRDLDCAKGFAILLVVLGHLVPASAIPPTGNAWYGYLRQVLYEFHMPFFMYLSGYVTFLSGAAETPRAAWPRLVGKRASRLLLPFVIFGLLIVAGKWMSSRVVHVDNLPGSVSQALLGLVWNTDYSPATSVWYVAVLFVFCVATPPALWLTRGRVLPLVAVAAVLYACPIPHVLYLNRVATYFVFFATGGACARHERWWLASIDRWFPAALAVFLAFCLAMPLFPAIDWDAKFLVAGILSMPALHALVRRPRLLDSTLLLRLGAFSFVIYLLNTPCIGLVHGLMLKLLPWDGANFLLYAPILMLAGTAGPILVKRYLFRLTPRIDRITD